MSFIDTLWYGYNINQDKNHRFVTDTQIKKWDNIQICKTITDWNNAKTAGFYISEKGAANAPISTSAVSGRVIESAGLLVQQVYPEDTSNTELIYYIRKGFINNSNITWSKWYLVNISLETVYTYILSSSFKDKIPSTATSIVFTDISPSSADFIDGIDDDGDGGVVAWLIGTTMYVSTQKSGQKVINPNKAAMFYNCDKLTSLDLSNFDTSKVTNMNSMFYGCSSLTSLDVSNFDTSKVTSMYEMFYNCSSLTSLDVSKWNTSKVTTMNSMFYGCSSLTSLDVSKWNTSNVTTMSRMFYNCSELTTIRVGDKFKWNNTLINLGLTGTWQDETGTQYTSSSTFPSNVAHTYTKVS